MLNKFVAQSLLNKKVAHACVNLLHACSQSFASLSTYMHTCTNILCIVCDLDSPLSFLTMTTIH